jgi:hypothetical protein
MNNLPPTMHVRHSRGRTFVFIILGLLAFLILVLLIALVAWRHHQSSQVEARLKIIRDAGYPTSAAELDRWYAAAPDDRNAALLYVEAAGQLGSGDPETDRAFQSALAEVPMRAPLPPDLTKRLTEHLAAHRESLELIHRAAQLTQSRYPVDLSTGFNALLPHLAEIRKLAQLLREQVVLEADAGRADQAVTAIVDGAALGRSLANEPLLISYLVRIAVNAIMVSGAEQAVNRVKLSETHLDQISRALASADDTNGVIRALAGERAAAIGLFQMDPGQAAALMSQGGAGPSAAQLRGLSALNRLTGLFDRDLVYYLDTMQIFIAAASQSSSDRSETAREFDERMAEAKRSYYILTALVAPALSKALDRDTENAARIRVATTALAVERHRLQHGGQVPDSLEALVPAFLKAIPLDPFTGEPLRFQKQQDGYVVYSVGTNRSDDGGERLAAGQRGSPPDITFTVER